MQDHIDNSISSSSIPFRVSLSLFSLPSFFSLFLSNRMPFHIILLNVDNSYGSRIDCRFVLFDIIPPEFEFYRAKKINAIDINYFYSKPLYRFEPVSSTHTYLLFLRTKQATLVQATLVKNI